MIQPQIPRLPIGIKGFDDSKPRRASQLAQLGFAKVMDVTQTLSPAPPIEQIIPRVHIGFFNPALLRREGCLALPRLDSRLQLFAVEELPVRVDEQPIGFEQLTDSLEDS